MSGFTSVQAVEGQPGIYELRDHCCPIFRLLWDLGAVGFHPTMGLVEVHQNWKVRPSRAVPMPRLHPTAEDLAEIEALRNNPDLPVELQVYRLHRCPGCNVLFATLVVAPSWVNL